MFGTDGNLYGITDGGGANGDGTLFDIPAGATAVSNLADFTSAEQSPDVGSGIVANGAGVATGITADHDIPFFGALFSSVPTASAQELHPDGGPFFFGGIADFIPLVLTPPPSLSPPLDPELKDDEDFVKELKKAITKVLGPSNVRADPAALAAVASKQASSAVQLRPLRATAKQLAPIRKLLATVQRQLSAATVQGHKQDTAAAQFTKEGKTITGLQAQLAKAKTAAKAAVQKKINAATALQTKYLNQNHSVYAVAKAQLTNIEAEESTISADVAALA